MKPRILLTGKNGQIGAELCRRLPEIGDLSAFGHADLDLANAAALRQIVRDVRPKLIVNAAAYTAVDQAEKESLAAFAVNSGAPAILAEEAKRIGAALVHYSTDYIFDGSNTTPYTEGDPPNPVNIYGKSKLAGEQAIRASGVPHLILRTAWIYARQGRNFLLTMLRLSTQRAELRVVRDQVGAPTWSREVAAGTVRILAPLAVGSFQSDSFARISGTYHMTAAGETSWHHFAEAILEESASAHSGAAWLAAATGGLPRTARRVTPISTAEYPTPARRPAYSVLSNALLRRTFGFQLDDWHAQLRSVFEAG